MDYFIKMCQIFDGSQSKSLTRYQKILKVYSFGFKNLLNLAWLTMKFHNCHHTTGGHAEVGAYKQTLFLSKLYTIEMPKASLINFQIVLQLQHRGHINLKGKRTRTKIVVQNLESFWNWLWQIVQITNLSKTIKAKKTILWIIIKVRKIRKKDFREKYHRCKMILQMF